jgi:hypothetical protein
MTNTKKKEVKKPLFTPAIDKALELNGLGNLALLKRVIKKDGVSSLAKYKGIGLKAVGIIRTVLTDDLMQKAGLNK